MNHPTTDDRLQMTGEGGLFKINNDTFTFCGDGNEITSTYKYL